MYDPEMRKDCPMRGTLGNCSPVGGFCMDAVSDEICEAVHNAYEDGYGKAMLNMYSIKAKFLQSMRTSCEVGVRDKMKESMKTSVEYLDWYFTCDDGTADKDAQKAWFELRGEFVKMDKKEIIRRLKKIAEHAIHTVGEPPFIIGLDDGIALKEAVRMLEKQEAIKPTINEYGEAYCICGENVGIIPNNKNLPTVRSKYCSECGRRMKWDD